MKVMEKISLSLSLNFNLSVLYWYDKNYTFVLPKQLQLGCLQIVHILINRNKIIIAIGIIQIYTKYWAYSANE